MRAAMFYKKVEGDMVKCELCPHNCTIPENKRGSCGVRHNKDGRLISLVYGKPCALAADPIEKKPFYHFLPHTLSFTLATLGCNLKCQNCQNFEISQARPEEFNLKDVPPSKIIELTQKDKCESIAYSYTEPTVYIEYVLAIAKQAKKANLKNVAVSNGFINEEPLLQLCKHLDAVNIDLKFFDDHLYRKMCSAKLDPVLKTLKILKENKIHLEITNLIIPTLNDKEEDIKKMCTWILKNLGEETPLHFSRFYPMHQLKNIPATPTETLEKARKIALNVGLNYVYIGNIPGHLGCNTYCPKCKSLLILRDLHTEDKTQRGECPNCKFKIYGVY
jgi:pyruvate formate lyase activating enzyme